MTRSKFDDATIVKTIQAFNANFDVSVAGLMKLKEAGVTETVMQAMLAKAIPPEHSSSSVTTASPHSPSPLEEAATNLRPGTYYWAGGVWHSMEQITMSGGGAKHMAKVFVPGLTPQMVWTFRGATAPIQVTEDKPLFCVKFAAVLAGTPYAPSPRDITIARFDEKKDHRELQVTSGGNVLTFKAGLGKDHLPDLTVTPLDGTTVIFSPVAPLRAGEYIISTASMGNTGYDFGLHPGTQK